MREQQPMQTRTHMPHPPKRRFGPLRGAMSIAALSLLAAACASFQGPGEFSVALGKKLRAENPETVDLSTVVAHPWDELLTFGPYSDRELNCSSLQLGWFDCRRTFASNMNENEMTLVFRVDGKLVRSERHARINGDFISRMPHPHPIPRSAAKFNVVRAGGTADGRPWIRLEYALQPS